MRGNWGFVVAAYGLSAVVLLAYWRRLARREREVSALRRGGSAARAGGER